MASVIATEKIKNEGNDVTPPYITLLFYNYVNIEDPQQLVEQQKILCKALNLVGRLRISTEGVNGCFGGHPNDIDKYINTVEHDSKFTNYFQNVDWKKGPPNKNKNVDEQRMDELIVKVTKELCSFGGRHLIPSNVTPGTHLSPEEFHNVLLEEAAKVSKKNDNNVPINNNNNNDDNNSNDIAIIDVRNRYETAIGKFQVDNVEYVDPKTRQFTDFANSISDPTMIQKLKKKKKVLMYCTGGVRCERASAFLKSKGINHVYQLKGGIHRYMEKYTDGGFFKGKNFVFDKRLAVGNDKDNEKNNEKILSKCKLCKRPWDDYGPAMRCVHCRLLVLVCKDCIDGKTTGVTLNKEHLVCDACMEERSVDITKDSNALPRYLHILCLHDNGSSARLMQHFLRRVESKLKRLVRFHFVDAPINTITMEKNNNIIINNKNRQEKNSEVKTTNTRKKRRLLRWKWYDDNTNNDTIVGKKDAKMYVLNYINEQFGEKNIKDGDIAPTKIDGIMGIGQGGELVDYLLLDLENNDEKISYNFGIHLKFYKPANNNNLTDGKKNVNNNNNNNIDMDIKTYVPPPDVIEKQHGTNGSSLYVPVPANSSHLKDANVIQTLRQYFSKILFKKPE